MPLGKADMRFNERDYYQAMPEDSDHADGPGDHPANVCGISDVLSGANSMAGQAQRRRHSDTDNHNDHSINTGRLRRSTLYSVTGYIIVTEFCERLAYYGFAGKFRLWAFGGLALFNTMINSSSTLIQQFLYDDT